ncbi:MAG: S8 family serine peptidase [Thermoleophilia bacterium]
MCSAAPAGRAVPAALLAALAAAALCGPAAAAPLKAGEPAAPAAAAAVELSGDFGRTPAGPRSLLVTFDDRPPAAGARARLARYGAVSPAVPEAGVWSVVPRRPATAREAVLRRGDVSGAEWSLVRTTDDRPAPPPPAPLGAAPTFTDLYFQAGAQWHLRGDPSWGPDLTTAGPRGRIAILDSGVDFTQPDWAATPGALVAGRSTLRGDDNTNDIGRTGHGTHVAGIAAAPANGVGVVGVAPAAPGSAEVIPVQIANQEGESNDETMIKGIRHAVNNGAKVINISSGGPGYSRSFQDTVNWATQKGVTIVASVGNDGRPRTNFPAGYQHVVGVGAQCDAVVSGECPVPFRAAAFSNRNRSVDLIAPGVDILSTVPLRVAEGRVDPGYALKDGTSMAAPFVTGVVALVQGANGNALSPYQVLRQLKNTATDLPPSGRDDRSGAGVVNPRAAVTLQAPRDDTGEVNDDVKWVGAGARLAKGRATTIEANADQDDDSDDVYPVLLRRGDTLRAVLAARSGRLDLFMWGTGTRTVSTGSAANVRRNLLAVRLGPAKRKVRVIRAKRTGRYFVNVYARRGATDYTLTLTRR